MIEVLEKLKPYSKSANKWLILNLLTAIIGNLMLMANPLLIGMLIGKLIPGNINFSEVLIYLGVIASLYVLGSITLWFSQAFSHNYATIVTKNLRTAGFHVITHTQIRYLDSVQTGDIMARFTNDIDLVFDALSQFFMNVFQGGTTILFALIIMIYLNIWLTMVVILVVPFILIYSKVTNKTRSARFIKLQKLTGDLTGTTKELFDEKKLIKAYNYEEESKRTFKNINDELAEVGTKAYFQASINNPTYRLFNNISFAMLGLVSIILVKNNIVVTVSALTSIIMYSQMFQRPFNEYSVLTANFMAGKAGVNRILDLINHDTEIENVEYNHLDRAKDGNIIFKDVYFSYNRKVKLIENFNLNVKKGSKVAIVGPTGSGKSTMINLLMRFYEIDSGDILVDGKSIKNYNRNVLRQSFGLVLQEPWLFAGTIKNNLKYGKEDTTDEEIISAAKKANAHDFIMNLKHGYDTVIDDSVNLSTGQKQLLTIARALITDPAILILDEATSNIDSLMEYEIGKTFNIAMEGKTSFVIAHRLNTIIDADTIIVMNNGKIVEMGSHRELILNNGFYKKLYLSQFAK